MDGAFHIDRGAIQVARSGNAVLAYAVGLDLTDLAPFVRSLRAVFSGQVVLAVDRQPTLIAWLSTHGVETVIAERRMWARPSAIARWGFFARFLRDRPDIRNVLIADVGSVVFQGDPFREMSGRLEFVEDEGQSANAALIRDLVGEALARKVTASAPVVAGMIAGPNEAVVRCCRMMQRLSAAAQSGWGSRIGVEQTVCTVVARLGLEDVHVRANFGRVAVVSDQQVVVDGRLLNPQGGSSPILHGYRHAARLADHVRDRWGLPRSVQAWPNVSGWGEVMRTLLAGSQPEVAPTAARRSRSSVMMARVSSPSVGRVERTASESA